MESAKLNVVRFNSEDVIATSGYLTLGGLSDNIERNLSIEYGSTMRNDFTNSDDMKAYLDGIVGGSYSYYYFRNGADYQRYDDLYSGDKHNKTGHEAYNGNYCLTGSEDGTYYYFDKVQ